MFRLEKSSGVTPTVYRYTYSSIQIAGGINNNNNNTKPIPDFNSDGFN